MGWLAAAAPLPTAPATASPRHIPFLLSSSPPLPFPLLSCSSALLNSMNQTGKYDALTPLFCTRFDTCRYLASCCFGPLETSCEPRPTLCPGACYPHLAPSARQVYGNGLDVKHGHGRGVVMRPLRPSSPLFKVTCTASFLRVGGIFIPMRCAIGLHVLVS